MDDLDGFRINKSYADRYNTWRQKEELQKLKDKYGNIDDDSSSSETEDDDAEALTTSLERDWLRTLAALKSKDPKIYDPEFKFYNEEDPGEGTSSDSHDKKKKKMEKPMFLKDYERKVILDKGGIISEDESDVSAEDTRQQHPGYYEEQEQIKQSLRQAIRDSDDSDAGDLLKPRQKDQEEKDREEEEYLLWLKGQKPDLEDDKQVGIELDPLKQYWTKSDLGSSEKFLRDYLLNKQYLDKDDGRTPTYDEIVLSEDEEELQKQDEFERKYNFRYEEPDPEFIKRFPRTINDSVRRVDTQRSEKRKQDKERKKQEKAKKFEELKQLKNLKKKEILDKLEKLRDITGNKEVGFSEKFLTGEFDPAEHDRLMGDMFDDGYYMEVDEEKPHFSADDDEQEEDWNEWGQEETEGGDKGEGHWQDEGAEWDEEGNQNFNMDADYDPSKETHKASSKKQVKGKKSNFAEALKRQKPVFDPEEKTFEEYFEEYYKLDYEDIIGDQPCRFKYRNVTPNDFGLDVAEILTCPDKELNAWVSVKKMSQHRTMEEEEFDRRKYSHGSRLHHKKHQILSSLAAQEEEDEVQPGPEEKKKKSKRKRKRKDKYKTLESDARTDGDDYNDSSIALPMEEHQSIISDSSDTAMAEAHETVNLKQNIESVKNLGGKKRKHVEVNVGSTSNNKSRTSGQFDDESKAKNSNNESVTPSHKEIKKSSEVENSETVSSHEEVVSRKKRKKKKQKKNESKPDTSHMSDARLKAYGFDVQKFRHTYGKKKHRKEKTS